MLSAVTTQRRITALARELAELRAVVPAHSMPASLLMRIEEVEDQLRAEQASWHSIRSRSEEEANRLAGDTP
jgi:hypothetical protein